MPALKKSSLLALLWVGVLFWESSVPGDPLKPLPFANFDKLVHLVIYSVLGFLLAMSLVKDWKAKSLYWIFFISVIAASLYGVSDEYHQSFVPFRSCDIWDWTADTIGASAGAFLYLALLPKRKI